MAHPALTPIIQEENAREGIKEPRILRKSQERIVRIGPDESQAGLGMGNQEYRKKKEQKYLSCGQMLAKNNNSFCFDFAHLPMYFVVKTPFKFTFAKSRMEYRGTPDDD